MSGGSQTTNPYRHYERLRSIADPTTLIPLVSDNPSHVGRNLHYLAATEESSTSQVGEGNNNNNENNNGNDEDIVFCHVPIMFRWTSFTSGGTNSNGGVDDEFHTDVSAEAYGGSAAALLAMHHFNTGNATIVDELDGISQRCPIRFTSELLNSQSSGVRAMRQLTKLLTRSPQFHTQAGTTTTTATSTTGANTTSDTDQTTSFDPQPCALMGSSWSSVTKKLATVTGVYDLPHITSSASSVELDNVGEYPLFARTHPSDASMAQLSIDYLATQLHIDFIGVLYLDNAFGNAYNLELLKYAAQYNMTVYSESFRPGASNEELLPKLSKLADTGYHYFLGIFFGADYQRIMAMAHELEIAGPEYFWMFNGALASSFINGATDLEANSPAAKATFGTAILTDEGGLPGLNIYHDRFLKVWRNIDKEFLDYFHTKHPPFPNGNNNDDDDNDDIDNDGGVDDNGSEPPNFERTKSFFTDLPPSHIAGFSYDAVISLGLSACEAWDGLGLNHPSELVTTAENDSSETTTTTAAVGIFSGIEHHSRLVDTTFHGASGHVIIGQQDEGSSSTTFSRTSESTFHVVSNILPLPTTETTSSQPHGSQTNSGSGGDESDETDDTVTKITSFQGNPLLVFDTSTLKWITYNNNNDSQGPLSPLTDSSFIYSDGSNTPPIQIPPVQHDHHLVTTYIRIVCIALASVAMLLSIGFFVYCCIIHRRHRVIRAAQPIFLSMICAGTFLMALSVIPTSIDDSYLVDYYSTTDTTTTIMNTARTSRLCDVSCILRFWLIACGFCLVFSALFSKLWRINMLVARAINFRRVQVRHVDVLIPFGIMLGANVIILTAWTVFDPLHWWREILDYDEYDRVIESTGYCTSDHFTAFVSPLILVNACAMILALWQAYVGRTVTTEFSESKYIAMATVCIFQAIFMGMPVIYIVGSQPTAYLFVYTGITVIICFSILLLLFVPKVHSIMYKLDPLPPIRTTTALTRGGGRGTTGSATPTLGTTSSALTFSRRRDHRGSNGGRNNFSAAHGIHTISMAGAVTNVSSSGGGGMDSGYDNNDSHFDPSPPLCPMIQEEQRYFDEEKDTSMIKEENEADDDHTSEQVSFSTSGRS